MSDRLIGFVEGMPFAEYDKIDAMNGSALLHMRKSPKYFKHCRENAVVPTDAMKLGTVIHSAILEPTLIGNIAVWGTKPEEKVRNGGVWENFKSANAGRTIITKAENQQVMGAVKGAWDHPASRKYLAELGRNELSMFWEEDGVYWKGRIDKVIETKATATIIDLKKTRSCAPRPFGAQAYELGMHIKAAIYVRGYHALTGIRPRFKWIALESAQPNEVAVYRATPDVLLLGAEQMDELLERWNACSESGYWPPALEEETDLILPKYAYPDEEAGFETETEYDEESEEF